LNIGQVITGSVESKFISKLPQKQLPETSLYLLERKRIEATMLGEAAGVQTSTERYAEQVVRNILRPSPKKHQWVGKLSTQIWMVSAFLWSTAWVNFLSASA
jgi:hypothetical protein